ncbi:MAG: flagellar hook-associated protein FlgL [Aquabacterium sp.]
MRLATSTRWSATLDNLMRRQAELSRAQEQMSGGLRVNRPSDDPTAAARAERARGVQARAEADQRALGVSRNAMQLAEGALGSGVETLQSARETLVNAGNATYGPVERLALANQLRQLRGQLLSVVNQGDGAGGFVFGGQGTTAAPFLDGTTGVTFGGTGGQINASSREQMPTTVDGRQIWLSSNSGNGVFETAAAGANAGAGWIDAGRVIDPSAITGSSYDIVFAGTPGNLTFSVLRDGNATGMTNVAYRSGQAIAVDGMSLTVSGAPVAGDQFQVRPSQPTLDPFTALDRAIAVLSDPSANVGQVQQAVNHGVRDMDAVLTNVQAARSVAGNTLSRLDAIEQRTRDRSLWAKQVQSDAEDLDMVQAVSEFQNRQSGYQVALQTYAMVQRLSMFDYLR